MQLNNLDECQRKKLTINSFSRALFGLGPSHSQFSSSPYEAKGPWYKIILSIQKTETLLVDHKPGCILKANYTLCYYRNVH